MKQQKGKLEGVGGEKEKKKKTQLVWFRQNINALNDNSKEKALESTQYSNRWSRQNV